MKPLKIFVVGVREVHVQNYKVKAKNAKEAKKLVLDGDGDIMENSLEYSHTLDADTWTVECWTPEGV